jgi:hypothetical protein
VGIGDIEMTDRDLRRMCAVQNSDDSGVGMTVPDVAYPMKAKPGIDPNAPIDSAEDKMRKLQAIYNDPRTKVADQIRALDLHQALQEHIDRVKAGDNATG